MKIVAKCKNWSRRKKLKYDIYASKYLMEKTSKKKKHWKKGKTIHAPGIRKERKEEKKQRKEGIWLKREARKARKE